MKFKNVSDKAKMFKTDGKWVDVQPGKFVDLKVRADKSEPGLELVEEKKKSKKEAKKESEEKPEEEPKEESEEEPKEEEKPKEAKKTLSELEAMTKDELNDYAAIIGLKEVSASDKKPKMIEMIVEYQDAME